MGPRSLGPMLRRGICRQRHGGGRWHLRVIPGSMSAAVSVELAVVARKRCHSWDDSAVRTRPRQDCQRHCFGQRRFLGIDFQTRWVCERWPNCLLVPDLLCQTVYVRRHCQNEGGVLGSARLAIDAAVLQIQRCRSEHLRSESGHLC
jgi:hypothetical protein